MGHKKTAGVIVYLSRSTSWDLDNLRNSLKNLDLYFNNSFKYPVVIFHEDFTPALMKKIRAATASKIKFFKVIFKVPYFLNRNEIPERSDSGHDIGYRHMCDFFSRLIYRHPALEDYDWYWRLDTDSFIREKINYDIFNFLDKNGYLYGFLTALKEPPEVVRGLWPAVKNYIQENKIAPCFLNEKLKDGEWDREIYYTNFEISKLHFWRSPEYMKFVEYLHETGGIYKYRWGDAPIHTLAVSIFLQQAKVYQFKDIAYQHQDVLLYPENPQNKEIANLKITPKESLLYEIFIRFINTLTSRRMIFSRIYRKKIWGNDGNSFCSGAGSRKESITRPYIDKITEFLKTYGSNKPRLVDLGCGDFFIGKNFIDYGKEYIGVDIVPRLIAEHNKLSYPGHVKFRCSDIVKDELPEGDICFLRQVLQHLSNKEIAQVLPKLKKYKIVFITEHQPYRDTVFFPNKEIRHGAGTRLRFGSGVYLDQPPFNIPSSRFSLVLEVPAEDVGHAGMIRTYKLEF